jgi:hypothetical protein
MTINFPRPHSGGDEKKYLLSRIVGGIFLALLLTGCGHDRAVVESDPPEYHADAPSSLPPISSAGSSAGSSSASPDPLLHSDGGSGSIASSDPLLSDGHSNSSADPMQLNDPLQGRAMPTDHSHWLHGTLRNASLTVLFNGVRQGEYSGLVDKDITMVLQRGTNSVTFIYTPSEADSAAQMEIDESEHDPPIPPLVTFDSQPVARDAPLTPTTQSFTFVAN